jgi:recombination protein RecA
MANHALALVEAALRARKLDCTLTWHPAAHSPRGGDPATALPARPAADAAVATDLARLDDALGGGLPRGQLSEIVGARSSGRTALLLQLLAAATRRGEIAALVDTFDRLDVPSAAAAEIDLDRLLWIRGEARSADRAVERGLKALNLVLQAGGFGVVAIDLADAPPAAVRGMPFTTWLRVQRTIEGSETACVIVGPQPLGRSAGGLTLALTGQPRWSSFLTGLDIAVAVVSPRRQVDGRVAIAAHVW